jgi:hypothetical protein
MKNILLSLPVILLMAACQSKSDTNSAQQIPLVPVYNHSVLSDTAKLEETFYQPKKVTNKPETRIVYVPVYRNISPKNISLPANENSPVVTAPVATSTGVNTVPASAGTGNNESAETASTVPQPEEKKGWSKAAKGAVIGAGAGAISGAIISKKKGKGALIGGIIGAAGGYVIGKGMDKKNNRFVGN